MEGKSIASAAVRCSGRPRLVRSIALALIAGAALGSAAGPAGAACAATDLPCQLRQIWDKVEDIGQGMKSLSAKVVDSAKKTADISGQLNAAKQFHDAMAQSADYALGLAQQATQMIAYHAANELAEYQAFAGREGGGASKVFRDELVALITSVQGTFNALLELERVITAIPGSPPAGPRLPDLDLSPLKKMVLAIPGYILYAPYRASALALGGGDKMTLKPLIEGIDAVRAAATVPANLVDVLADCASVDAPAIRTRLSTTASLLTGNAATLKLVSLTLLALSKTSAEGAAAGLAAGGHLSLRIKTDVCGQWGTMLAGLADLERAVAGAISARLDHCQIIVNQETMMRMLETPGSTREKSRPVPKYLELLK